MGLQRRWDKLNLVRVYTKPHGKMPDYSAPVVLRSTRCTVEDFVSSNNGHTLPALVSRRQVTVGFILIERPSVQRYPS